MFFSRRRVQAMLDDLEGIVPIDDINKIISVLEKDQRTENVNNVPALNREFELAIIWAASQLGQITYEPNFTGSNKKPDLISSDLVDGRSVAIEITTISDNSLSSRENLRKTSDVITSVVGKYSRGVAKRLFFEFGITFGYDKRGNYFEKACAVDQYKPSDAAREKIANWIRSDDFKSNPLVLKDQGVRAILTVKDDVLKGSGRYFCQDRPEAYSTTDNPFYRALKKKIDHEQLCAAPKGYSKILLVGNTGSTLLSEIDTLGERDALNRKVSAKEIINRVLFDRISKVDAILVVTPRVEVAADFRREKFWLARAYSLDNSLQNDLQTLADSIVRLLPVPSMNATNAATSMAAGWSSLRQRKVYLSTRVSSDCPTGVKIELSARLLLDFLAGRIDEAEFRYFLQEQFVGKNLFEIQLAKGTTIQKTEIVDSGLDKDDNVIVLHFGDDPSARDYRLPKGHAKNDSS